MKVIMIGSGGREHALIKSLKQSQKIEKIICIPGNGGISFDAECVKMDISNIPEIVKYAKDEKADLVFVAPDDPLAAGMVDALENAGIRAFGPVASAAEIESSKVFSKNLMKKYGIPTAKYETFDNSDKAKDYINGNTIYPVVIKADGLALGKGVIIAENKEEAFSAIDSMMTEKIFKSSGEKIVIEEFLCGPEVSVLAFTDGKTVAPMVSSMDHKRALDGDMGLNTGGMGTVSPNPYYTKEIADECMKNIFLPTVNAMNKEGRTFKGCLYFGLMITKDGVKVIEYNARFGDPETQVILPCMKTPLIDIVDAIIDERLGEITVEFEDCACACVIIASGGYPLEYKKGLPISGLDAIGQTEGAVVYHAGTVYENGIFLTNGGRVLGVTAKGDTLDEALNSAYTAANSISFENSFFRHDIGKKANFAR